MSLALDRPDFMPPPSPGLLRAIGLALLAHVLLLAALTWGVRWKRETQVPVIEAELWSTLEQQAAPALQAPSPPETPAPEPPSPLPSLPPSPKPDPQPPAPPPARPAAPPAAPDIAVTREATRKQPDRQQEARAREQEQQKLQAKLKREQEKKERDRRNHEQRVQEQKLAEQKKKQQEAKPSKPQAQVPDLRKEQMDRITGLAEATGSASASGTALKAAAPSASYQGRVVARVRPNIVYTESISGNPQAEVEVRTAPDGTIVSSRLTQSSGNPAWDEAVLKALVKTEVLPRDTDGDVRVPPLLVITFRPVN